MRSIALKFTKDPDILEDLTQEGYLGLLRASEKFDPSKAKFTTFCYRPIYWAILKKVQKEQKYQQRLDEYKKSVRDTCPTM